ncbi:hypothetical protein CDAR_617381 [Caerostris darwini]|uniref:Uncharacterized protein n=1 Tax=Caerostris darwini TaxID=1538125 RepID=A0AAV4SZR5_9ARAC|nr:hypothetical protein CDAR_617381 [Caerostris darwini]
MDRSNRRTGVARAKNVRLITGGLWTDGPDNAQPARNLPAGRAAGGANRERRGGIAPVPQQPVEFVLPEEQRIAGESGGPVTRLFRRFLDYFRRG